MSTFTSYVCDRCSGRVTVIDETELRAGQLVIPASLTGSDMESHAPNLHWCVHCQPFVAALLAGLFSPDVIATRPETLLAHDEEWRHDPIDLNAVLQGYIARPVPAWLTEG